MDWETYIKNNKTKFLFELEQDLQEFLFSSKLKRMEKKDEQQLFELTVKNVNYLFVKRKNGSWRYPSNAFVQFGTRLSKLFPFIREYLEKK